MFQLTVKDFKDAYYTLNDKLFFEDAYEHVRSLVTAHSFHNEIIMQTANCDLNIHDINYTSNKWKQLINLYLEPVQLGVMVARLLHYATQRKHRLYVPDIGMQFKERRNVSGACLMSITVGYNQSTGWHAEVFTRASELTMRWYIDLIFVHVLLREIGKFLNFEPGDVTVFWHMVSTYQSITSMPWFLILAGKEDWFQPYLSLADDLDITSWQRATVRRYLKCYIGDDYQNFRVQRRPAEAYRMMKGEIPKKQLVWTKDLMLPDIDINQEMTEAEEEDLFGKGGYR